jgi:hypothetical protein
MNKRVLFLVLATIVAASVLAAGGPFETYRTDRNVGFFYNTTDLSFTGLRVTFSAAVEPVYVLGIGAEMTLALNEEGVLTFAGSVPPYGIWEIDWPLDGTVVVEAAWLAEDGTEVAIDVHAPMARMAIFIPPYVPGWCSSDQRGPFVPFDADFDGTRSSDPDGLPLAFYEWDWSDLVHLDGAKVTREFRSPGWYWVTLTVWDADGLTDSVTESFYVPPWRCAEEED